MNVAGDDQFIVKVPNNAGEIDYRVGDNIFVDGRPTIAGRLTRRDLANVGNNKIRAA